MIIGPEPSLSLRLCLILRTISFHTLNDSEEYEYGEGFKSLCAPGAEVRDQFPLIL